MRALAICALLLLGCQRRPAPSLRGNLPTIPARCMGTEGARLRAEGTTRERFECAWAFFRRGCALGQAKSCEGQRRVERELLEMAAGFPDR